ncbi:GNAT family N-acetyltransferase [Sneathiella limimaris]|uniref:GNAT family N-acetyltransferase n=1 Tax=Sneathiella limimaris TaxID=1964213 RepID=UPI00146F744A|nr:GNAT family N-acetyltransferase [Sneathiella limimaris]
MRSPELEVKSLTVSDADRLLALSLSLDWDFTLKYWQVLLTLGQVVGCCDENGELVGTASFICYSDQYCFVGAVIVAEHMQGQGIGKSLMAELHRRIDKLGLPAKLIATEEGFPLYQKLGYEVVDHCTKMVIEESQEKPALPELPGVTFRPITAELRGKIQEFDAQFFGGDRTHVLSALQQAEYPGIVALDKASERVLGFAMMIDRFEHLCIGPLVAETENLAIALIQMMIYGQSRAIRTDSLSDKASFRSRLSDLGFKQDQTSPMMLRSQTGFHQAREQVFGIVTQAIG